MFYIHLALILLGRFQSNWSRRGATGLIPTARKRTMMTLNHQTECQKLKFRSSVEEKQCFAEMASLEDIESISKGFVPRNLWIAAWIKHSIYWPDWYDTLTLILCSCILISGSQWCKVQTHVFKNFSRRVWVEVKYTVIMSVDEEDLFSEFGILGMSAYGAGLLPVHGTYA